MKHKRYRIHFYRDNGKEINNFIVYAMSSQEAEILGRASQIENGLMYSNFKVVEEKQNDR